MKPNKSPLHKTIQLRRKTQKIVLPKAYWDLSNKENENGHEENRSKNTSSKKSSLDKKNKPFKKTDSLTQNMFKKIKDNGKKKEQIQNKPNKINFTQKVTDQLQSLHEGLRGQPGYPQIKTKYRQIFNNSQFSQKQRKMGDSIQNHLYFWMQKCQQLKNTLQKFTAVTPKMQHNISQESEDLDDSICSYLADPQMPINLKSIKPDLKEKLQLNFSKVDEYRKKEFNQK